MSVSQENMEPTNRHDSHAASTYKAFLKDLQRDAAMPKELAERAAVAVLSVLERRVLPGTARHLEAQLPSILRELLGQIPQRRFGRAVFLEMVAESLGVSPAEAEPIVLAVFRAVRHKISDGEAQIVGDELPKDLAELWLNP
jgi:uncharacterized protein (DUF2267 family)